MQKEAAIWLKSIGFRENNAYYMVYQYDLPEIVIGNRAMSVRFEVESNRNDVYKLSATMEIKGTVEQGYSEATVWLFSLMNKDIKELVRDSVVKLNDFAAAVSKSCAEISIKL